MLFTLSNTLEEMDSMRREMDQLLQRTHQYFFSGSPAFPPINLYHAPEQVTVVAELPGLKREDIEMTFTQGVLTLKGQRSESRYGDKDLVLRQERSLGAFEKHVRIPVDVNPDAISARLQNGVLTVTLPKSDAARPRQIAVN